jgi:hypothetical protein
VRWLLELIGLRRSEPINEIYRPWAEEKERDRAFLDGLRWPDGIPKKEPQPLNRIVNPPPPKM